MMLEEVGRCAPGAPPDAWIDMLYACTATMERGSFLPCKTPIGFQSTLTRSQSQVVQFLNGGSVFACPSIPSSESFYPLECKRSPSRQLQPPVMHPNLVCTLKSILSPTSAFDSIRQHPSCYYSTPSGDNRCMQSGISQSTSEMASEVQEGAEYSAKADSPESTSWPRSRNRKQSLQQEGEAVVVPVDLIQNRRPYQCAFTSCQRTFKNPQTMRMHHRTHFTDTSSSLLLASSLPLKAGHNKKIASRCPTCYKTFVGLYELRRHFGRKHSEGEKRHACRKCGKRFYVEVDVRDHEKLCGKPIVCICGLKFAFKCNLVAHKRSHPECHDRPALEDERKISIPSPPA